MCLNFFSLGLKDPLGSTIRAVNPPTPARAFADCMKEQNISYSRHTSSVAPRQQSTSAHKTFPNRTQIQSIPRYPNPPQFNFSTRPPQHIITPQNYQQARPRPFQNPQFQPNNQYRINNNFQNKNFTRPQNQNSSNKPEPMDVSSGNTIQMRNTYPTQFRLPQNN